MGKLSDLFFARKKLIDEQVDVYSAWTVRHHGWCLNSDQAWIRMFINTQGITDVEDSSSQSLEAFLRLVDERYQSKWAVDDARVSVLRFMRYYEARTKAFTKFPRRAPNEKRRLSTGQEMDF